MALGSSVKQPEGALTPREIEVLKLLCDGLSSKRIGESLHISSKTAEFHRANLYRKLGVKSKVELVRYAIREGIVKP